MNGRVWLVGLGVLAGVLVMGACSSDTGGREVAITQLDDTCTPDSIAATKGEKLKLVVKNDGSKDKELEGIEGTKFEEIEVPKGKTRTVSWSAPNTAGSYKMKCYIPGGASTIITINVS